MTDDFRRAAYRRANYPGGAGNEPIPVWDREMTPIERFDANTRAMWWAFWTLIFGLAAVVFFGVQAEVKRGEAFRAACLAAGGDKVERAGQFATARNQCWNTTTGARIFIE